MREARFCGKEFVHKGTEHNLFPSRNLRGRHGQRSNIPLRHQLQCLRLCRCLLKKLRLDSRNPEETVEVFAKARLNVATNRYQRKLVQVADFYCGLSCQRMLIW